MSLTTATTMFDTSSSTTTTSSSSSSKTPKPPNNQSTIYPEESRLDAYLFSHSAFLRNHFSPARPTHLPTKHELIQESYPSTAFPGETPLDAKLFEHSKFLRKHVKHVENAEAARKIAGKGEMLRRREVEEAAAKKTESDVNEAQVTAPASQHEEVAELPSTPSPAAYRPPTLPERSYASSASLVSAATSFAAAPPGLIESHPTTMESEPVVERPVLHGLLSNVRIQASGVGHVRIQGDECEE